MKWTPLALTVTALLSLFSRQGTATAAEIRSILVGQATPVADNSGDTWVSAWAKDGGVYTPSNDTEGFRKIGSCNLAFNRIDGEEPLRLSGVTINPMGDYGAAGEEGADGCTWKSSGCCAVDGVLYWVVARHKYGEKSGDPTQRQTAANASIIKSTNCGRTWVRSAKENYEAPMFPGRRFATPYFIEYGQDGKATLDNADKFVYAISNNGFWDNGDNLIVGRVRRDKIGNLNGKDWEYYTGGDGLDDSAWDRDVSGAMLVLDSPGRLGMNGAVYVPDLDRYLMIGWYYPAGGGKMKDACRETIWDFYQAPKPWGPWTKISSHRFFPQGYYSPLVWPKFSRDGGRSLFVFAAGDWNNPEAYRLTAVPISLRD
jgi:hypothetical protein